MDIIKDKNTIDLLINTNRNRNILIRELKKFYGNIGFNIRNNNFLIHCYKNKKNPNKLDNIKEYDGEGEEIIPTKIFTKELLKGYSNSVDYKKYGACSRYYNLIVNTTLGTSDPSSLLLDDIDFLNKYLGYKCKQLDLSMRIIFLKT